MLEKKIIIYLLEYIKRKRTKKEIEALSTMLQKQGEKKKRKKK